jgi:phenylpropionate dioxygenase-like ring-hydroxylating dioxygenase large terminal subunit
MSNQPSIPSYFSLESQRREIQNLFNSEDSIKYIGHELMVPNKNDYRVIPCTSDRWTLFNNDGDTNLISNVCLHRQSKLLNGSGNKKIIGCKVHCWSYENTGKVKSTPFFKDPKVTELKSKKLSNWNGLLFDGRTPDLDLKAAGVDQYINFDGFFFHSSTTTEYNFNWKTFSEIYLENYHVFGMHPGLKDFVNPTDLEWVVGKDYSLQKVGINSALRMRSGTPKYAEWHKAISEAYPSELPRYGAIWIYIYPNIMIEWYPNVLVVSTIHPIEPQKCVNHVEFYYPKAMYEANPDYFRIEQEVYEETAIEDEEACLLLDAGRKSLFAEGGYEYGPVEPFLEMGVNEFYEYLKKSQMDSDTYNN